MAEGENKESAAVVENDETCTITEFLDMQEEMEKDAYAVLGGSNHKNCSYDEVILTKLATTNLHQCFCLGIHQTASFIRLLNLHT